MPMKKTTKKKAVTSAVTNAASMKELKRRLVEISHIGSTLALLNWDQEVSMPKKGADHRAATISHLSGLAHQAFVSIDHDGLLSVWKKQLDLGKLSNRDAAIVRDTWRSFERQKKLPEAFVREMAEVTSKSQTVWAEARAKNNFKLFLPWLKKIVELKRKEAELVGYTDSPYDALIDTYEPGMTGREAATILNDLKDFLVPFLRKIQASGVKVNSEKIKGKFPLDKQFKFNQLIAEKMGFDLDAGRIDKSTHPFTTNFHPHDVRFTTRYRENDILYSIGSTIHEAGHALYEQGLPSEHFGTPLAEAISLGIHESQSRMWENMIGKSREFWKYFYKKLQKEFPLPFAKISLNEFYTILNNVKPSLIRTEADEVTYNLHIIIRFEIEREMIEGTIDVADLPKIWKSKVKEYLGIDVPNDARGVLQDVHWSCGLIGYFPTYSFGNLYAAQFYARMVKDIPKLEQKIATGNLLEIREWLRKNIHAHGKLFTASGLAKALTGEELNSKYFTDYLEKKYGEV